MSAELQEILRLVREIHAKAMSGKNVTAGTAVAPASDADLADPRFGDPVVEKDPPAWLKGGGESMIGKRLSETSPEYCAAVAALERWKAGKDQEANAVDAKGRPKAQWSLKRAAIALAWEAKLNAAKIEPVAPASRPADEWQQQEMDGHDEAF